VVQDTLSFYGFFKQDKPHGEHRAWVCRSISCALRGGEEVLEHLCQHAGIRPGETTADGKLTIEFAECLGGCDFAPCMLVGETLHKDLTAEKADDFLRSI
jgi:NADH-quinone oxidoreductase subunit E